MIIYIDSLGFVVFRCALHPTSVLMYVGTAQLMRKIFSDVPSWDMSCTIPGFFETQ